MLGTKSAPDMCLALHTTPEVVQEINLFSTCKSIACWKVTWNWSGFLFKVNNLQRTWVGLESGITWAVIICRMGMAVSKPRLTFQGIYPEDGRRRRP